ncbi:transglycosylase SLT domain-containing protein [Leucobacter sp. CX328]|uniref:aggregation-promoting factor C-terminal-like domain-containing protein n=1 Tax=unclassified Leucobacter TaxID=2621730 RepID=UPI0033401EA4
MTASTTRISLWRRVRGPIAGVTAAGFLGMAILAPMTTPSASADEEFAAQYPQLFQEFVANENPNDDFVLPAVEGEEIPKPKPVAKTVETSGSSEDSSESASTESLRYTGGGAPSEWMAAAGIAQSDWGFVDYIASRESGWNPNATNPDSGACGLIQAYPCSKVPGNGYNPVDNLQWANGYAVGRYGSWAAAYDFWTSNHWW